MKGKCQLAVLVCCVLGLASCDLWLLDPPPFKPPPCDQDERVQVEQDSGLFLCVPCEPGATNRLGDERLDGTSQCDPTLCGPSERVNDHECVPCGPGETNERGDDASGEDTLCDPVLCGFGERVQGNVCIACALGAFNKAGDDASGGDTTCDDTAMCAQDERVASGECVTCDPGTTRPAGDPLIEGDTECDPISCEEDRYVSSNACIECAPGTTNEAGDDATGVDTACDAVICGRDEYVREHVCLMCPEDTTNEPGDDASGPETQCEDSCMKALGVSCEEFEVAYVKASNTDIGDEFGRSIALDGDLMVVGAPSEDSSARGVDGDPDDDSVLGSGDVYVFERDANGTWSQSAYLKASNTGNSDGFGSTVAVSGAIVAVGAPGESSAARGVDGDQDNDGLIQGGAAYVFEREASGRWSQVAYLKASNTDQLDRFASSMALEGNVLAIGARLEDGGATGVDGEQFNDDRRDSGAVYVFERSILSGKWSQTSYVKSPNSVQGGNFGSSIDIDRGVLFVGAPEEQSSTASDTGGGNGTPARGGMVYTLKKSGMAWVHEDTILAAGLETLDRFGSSIAVHGSVMVVGASGDDGGIGGVQGDVPIYNSGAAYVFEQHTDDSDKWRQVAYLKASNPDGFRIETIGGGDSFGNVAVSGETIVVSANLEDGRSTGVNGSQDSNDAQDSGAVYVFQKAEGGDWTQVAYVKACNTDAFDSFGRTVALDGETLVIGANGEDSLSSGFQGKKDDNQAASSGAVYIRQIAPKN